MSRVIPLVQVSYRSNLTQDITNTYPVPVFKPSSGRSACAKFNPWHICHMQNHSTQPPENNHNSVSQHTDLCHVHSSDHANSIHSHPVTVPCMNLKDSLPVHTDFCHMHQHHTSTVHEKATWDGCKVDDDLSFLTARQINSLVKMRNGNRRGNGI